MRRGNLVSVDETSQKGVSHVRVGIFWVNESKLYFCPESRCLEKVDDLPNAAFGCTNHLLFDQASYTHTLSKFAILVTTRDLLSFARNVPQRHDSCFNGQAGTRTTGVGGDRNEQMESTEHILLPVGKDAAPLEFR